MMMIGRFCKHVAGRSPRGRKTILDVPKKSLTPIQRCMTTAPFSVRPKLEGKGFARKSWLVVKYSYCALALIPTSFSVASAVSLLALQDRSKARAYAFWAWTGWLSLPLSVVLFACAPVSLILDPVDRTWMDEIQRLWARWTVWPFLTIQVDDAYKARELLKSTQHGCIVVSNHRSMLDVFVLFAALDVPLRFVSKKEIFFIPLVGWVMGIIGHVSLVRGDKNSGKSVLENCKRYLREGRTWSVVFFAEGSRTRTSDESNLSEFKIGAFRLAESVGAPVLPVSISGSGRVMGPGDEFKRLDGSQIIRVTVHDPIVTGGAEELRSKAFFEIKAGLTARKLDR